MEKELTFKECDRYFINVDLSVNKKSFNLILIYDQNKNSWHLVVSDLGVSCYVSTDKSYNISQLKENSPAESTDFESYIEMVAEAVEELLTLHKAALKRG